MTKPKHKKNRGGKPVKNIPKKKPVITSRSTKKSNLKLWLGLLAIAVTALVIWKFFPGTYSASPNDYTIGPVNTCKYSPAFITTHKLQQPVAFDFSQRGFTGFRMVEIVNGTFGRSIQLPTWDDAGHLGLYATDRKGHLYITPIPHISLQENKPEEQNKVYKVNSQSGEMKEFIDLPWVKPPSLNNPFGALGITYDCFTESLYVSSVAGSGRNEEIGRIFQIDLETKKIVDTYEGLDVIGLGIFVTKSGKKLYCGSARASEIYSIDLDENGRFVGEPQFVLSLVEQDGGSFDKGHRIRFFEDNRMEIKGIDFNYSLMVASDPMRNIYNFKYNEETDDWDFMEVYKQ